MKTPLKFLASLPLAATIALGGFTSEARAQAVVNVPIAANASIDQCAGKATQANQFQIVICNQTGSPLIFSGHHRSAGTFPITQDVPAYSVSYVDWGSDIKENFEFASNFKIGDSGKFIQFAAANRPDRSGSDQFAEICNFQTPVTKSLAQDCQWQLNSHSYGGDTIKIDGTTYKGKNYMAATRKRVEMWVFQVK